MTSFTKEVVSSTENIQKTDNDTKLEMYCYEDNCARETPEFLKNCRGLVFDTDGNLVLKTFTYTDEYFPNEVDIINTLVNSNEYKFFKSIEGTLLRVFSYDGKWYISTHHRLDAFRSKWGSRESFGLIFLKALTRLASVSEEFKQRLENVMDSENERNNILTKFLSTLDTTKHYMFLVGTTSETRIVCRAPSEYSVYHTGTFFEGVLDLENSVDVPKIEEYNFTTTENLVKDAEDMDENSYQGIIAFDKNGNNFKVVNNRYNSLYKIRGNEPSIKFRYLQVRLDKEKVNLLYKLYPTFSEEFNEYENIIHNVAKNITNSYIDRFLKKQFVTLPKEEYIVLQACHAWHLEDRENNRISFNKVMEIVNNQPFTNLNKIIKRIKFEIFSNNKIH
jgi:hypothetical protein